MPWNNTLKPIVERDVSRDETYTGVSGVMGMGGTIQLTTLRRAIRWVTTRYVGGTYEAACALRDALNAQYSPQRVTDPTVETEVVAAAAGQFHVLATVRTIGAWTQLQG